MTGRHNHRLQQLPSASPHTRCHANVAPPTYLQKPAVPCAQVNLLAIYVQAACADRNTHDGRSDTQPAAAKHGRVSTTPKDGHSLPQPQTLGPGIRAHAAAAGSGSGHTTTRRDPHCTCRERGWVGHVITLHHRPLRLQRRVHIIVHGADEGVTGAVRGAIMGCTRTTQEGQSPTGRTNKAQS